MKTPLKSARHQLILMLGIASIFCLTVPTAEADIKADADTILNWSERALPSLLTPTQPTQIQKPWYFRAYPNSDLYTGINSNDNGVYYITGENLRKGAQPVFFDLVANALKLATTPNPQATSLPFTLVDMPFLSERWFLVNVGQTIGGKVNGKMAADVRAPLAWALTQGVPEVVVAVLDTGIAYDHPDFKDKIWTNPKETLNGLDDDGNGYVDDVHGWDFLSNDNDPQDSRAKIIGDTAEIFHGTAVASIVTAIAPKIRIMPLRVNNGSEGSEDKFAQAVTYARNKGARVVNMSLGAWILTGGFPKLRAAIEASPEVLFIAAAMNDANNADILQPLPCVFPLSNVICVTATDEQDNFAKFRTLSGPNYGPKTVHMAAPGADMLVAQPPITTTYANGFEADQLSGWQPSGVLGGNWDVTSEVSRTGGKSLRYRRPSPNGVYNQAGYTRSANPINLSGLHGCWLEGWVRSDIDKGYLFDLRTRISDKQYYSQGLSVIASTKGQWKHFMVSLAREEAVGKFYPEFSWTEVSPGNAGSLYIDDLKMTCNSNVYTGRDYGYVEGTSFATPLVAGAAALAFSYKPTASMFEVKAALIGGGTPIDGLSGKIITPVRLDAYKTLLAIALPATNLARSSKPTLPPDSPINLTKDIIGEYAVTNTEPDSLSGALLAWLSDVAIETIINFAGVVADKWTPAHSPSTANTSASWEQMLKRAEDHYKDEQKKNLTSKGYQHQVLNLLCAATRSTRASCGPMIPYYEGVKPNWAGPWVKEVFNRFLGDPNRVKDAKELVILQKIVDDFQKKVKFGEQLLCTNPLISTAEQLCSIGDKLVSEGDVGSLIAGTLHFWNNLKPNFDAVTEQTVRSLPANVDSQTLKITLDDIRSQHQALFDNAVKPGFEVVAGSGEISPLGKAVAQLGVPLFAEIDREDSIKNALIKIYGQNKGETLYQMTR